jgi:hypothetical protein
MNRRGGTAAGRGRRWPRIALLVLAVWFLGVVGAATVGVIELNRGADAVARARRGLDLGHVSDPATETRLRAAAAHFGRAHAALANPGMAPARWVPFAGRQLRAAASMAGAARRVTTGGAAAASRTRHLLATHPTDGPSRLRTIDGLDAILADAERDLEGADLGDGRALTRPLARKRRAFATDLAEAEQTLRTARTATATVAELLRGPKRYLLLASNNAEMRAGSGMFLSAGVLDTTGGDFTLSPMQRTGDLTLPGDGVAYEGDLHTNWSFLHPNREWRNLGASARFDTTAPLAARMWEAQTGQTVDGVLAVDVSALEAILAATGPIEVDGRTLGADGVAPYVLHDQYRAVEVGPGHDRSQAERREALGSIASATVDGLQRGGFDSERLATGLLDAIHGRHVLVWSSDGKAQAGWEAAGAAGTLRPDSLLVSVLNRGGNKLDPFLRPELALAASPSPGGTSFELTVNLHNRVGRDEVPYIAGPGEGIDQPPGTYIGLVSLQLPGEATGVAVDGAPVVVAGGDGPTRVVAAELVIARGATAVVTVRFRLPGRAGSLRVEPSGRLPAGRWRTGTRTWTDRRARTVSWQRGRIVVAR